MHIYSGSVDFIPIRMQLSQFVDLGFEDLDQNPVIGGDDDNTLWFIDTD